MGSSRIATCELADDTTNAISEALRYAADKIITALGGMTCSRRCPVWAATGLAEQGPQAPSPTIWTRASRR
jgi:hypothetical protein